MNVKVLVLAISMLIFSILLALGASVLTCFFLGIALTIWQVFVTWLVLVITAAVLCYIEVTD